MGCSVPTSGRYAGSRSPGDTPSSPSNLAPRSVNRTFWNSGLSRAQGARSIPPSTSSRSARRCCSCSGRETSSRVGGSGCWEFWASATPGTHTAAHAASWQSERCSPNGRTADAGSTRAPTPLRRRRVARPSETYSTPYELHDRNLNGAQVVRCRYLSPMGTLRREWRDFLSCDSKPRTGALCGGESVNLTTS